MKSSLAVFVCLLSAAAASAQTPAPTVEQLPSMPNRAIVQDAAVPCQNCANERDAMPFFERRWPPLYRGGPPVREPNAFYDTGRLTWWFIPTPRALVQAICP